MAEKMAKRKVEDFRDINLDEVLADANQKMRQKKYREAARLLSTVTSMVPEHIDAWNNLGVAYLLMEEYEAAEMAIRSGLEQDPENPQLIKNSHSDIASPGSESSRRDETFAQISRASPAGPRCAVYVRTLPGCLW